MNEQTIQIARENQDRAVLYRFIGVLDASSRPELESLTRQVPDVSEIVLDFSEVGRINSMGLALLLKLLKAWEDEGKQIQAINLNRMASILFKITGLGRFLPDGEGDATPTPRKIQVDSAVEENPKTPAQTRDRLNLFASLQTSQQLNGWFLFNTYLQRRLQKPIQFFAQTLAEQTANDREEQTDLVFARPFEACRLIYGQGYIPLCKPEGETEEVVILAPANDSRSLEDYASPKVAIASKQSFTYLLGRFLCDERDLDSNAFRFHESGNDIKAIQYLIRQQVDWVMMPLKTYSGLSSLSRRQTRVLDQTQTELAAHLFCIAPYLDADFRQSLQTVLTQMHTDEKGLGVLEDIEIQAWEVPESAEVDLLLKVFETYRY
ncbi:PhnD/SsuA/transferrin family substrate-binding protein [Methylohalobius crimeensis]|uniref:PhnD/SsuA/transferrin family substrate-binding protein n=1 Tax=Methylohalobius crimeensis TaxID=244365 RepID=UPI0003B5C3A6|nr:PhnD/SsuA/transferrin family substrate-binding protein [Methylohalobius crimeensis]